MKIVFSGHESKGAWKIRAKQMAGYLNAKLDPTFESKKADLVILIKLPEEKILEKIKNADVPIVWDVLDCWSQIPKNNMSSWNQQQMMEWFKNKLELVNPVCVIAATNRMKEDSLALGYKSETLHHHHRPKISINPIREEFKTIGIEGTPFQYGQWVKKIDAISKSLDLDFRANLDAAKDCLHKFDAIISIRQDTGYATKYWKSNIKLANAHASGTPGIFNREQGYLDTACGQELWADTEEEIIDGIETLKSYDLRRNIHEEFIKSAITLEQSAEEYKRILNSL